MESLPKLNTVSDTFSSSARNSYASATDSGSRSARSSYASISDFDSASSRSSYSSIPEYLNRVSSFSRTLDSYIPDSAESTPIGSRDVTPDSPATWTNQDSVTMLDDTSVKTTSQRRSRSHSKSGAKDGPSALKELQNVKNVICVAFGAFDRYYISWEDNNGDFHQESHKLPESLDNWLFPPDGQTRHLPSLQVSFGSNDDFFASDQHGKLTSRDGTPPADRKPPPRLADVARGFVRRKAHTISSPRLPEELYRDLEEMPPPLKLERRKTFLEGQYSPRTETRQSTGPLSLSLHGRRKSKMESIGEQTSIPINLSLHPRRESRGEMQRIVERESIQPENPLPPKLDMEEELAKAEKRRSVFIAAERQMQLLKNGEELPTVEQTRSISPSNPLQLTCLESRTDFIRTEQRRSTLNGMPRLSWPERKTLLMNRESILSDQAPRSVPKPVYVDASVQTDLPGDMCAELNNFPVHKCMPTIHLPPRHYLAIGSMADFCRGQYRLGDALRFV